MVLVGTLDPKVVACVQYACGPEKSPDKDLAGTIGDEIDGMTDWGLRVRDSVWFRQSRDSYLP